MLHGEQKILKTDFALEKTFIASQSLSSLVNSLHTLLLRSIGSKSKVSYHLRNVVFLAFVNM
jgi:hypothetical protein